MPARVSAKTNIGSLTRGVLQDPDSPRPCRTSALPHRVRQTISNGSFNIKTGRVPVSETFVTKTEQGCGTGILRKLDLQQRRWVEVDALPSHGQVQMRSGRAAAPPAKSNYLIGLNLVTFLYADL